MCGIVGYVGSRPCQGLLLEALEQLEYRGYDSAGLSLLAGGRLERTRAVGNLSRLRRTLQTRGSGGAVATLEAPAGDIATTGIGHTRWATHGGVNTVNAHPHADSEDRIHIVLNGIVENHAQLRRSLFSQGIACISETDAEVVAHVIARHHEGDLAEAVLRAREDLEGHFAFLAVCADEPDLLIGARRECPLVVGVGRDERFLASAGAAFSRHTHRVQLVEDGEVVAVTPGSSSFFDVVGRPVHRSVKRTEPDQSRSGHQGFETFMLKEIHEQPKAVAATIEAHSDGTRITLPDLGLTVADMRRLKRLSIVGCGTSYHAGLLGRHAIQEWAGLPVDFDIASEYRYGDPRVGAGDLVIGTTQSGETADTLAAMRLARGRGARVVALTNVPGSQATRDADGALFTRAGMEVGVAATKTFVCQVTALYLLALRLAHARGTLSPERLHDLRAELAALPDRIDEVLRSTAAPMREIAERFAGAGFFLYMGRQAGLPVALEGALKLKEISYIPCDAYAAGEMKHGPIAMLSERTPVVCIATASPVLGKLLSNMAEVRARRAHVIALATEGAKEVAEHAEEIVYLPATDWLMGPVLAAIPLQLLAYHVARAKGLNVDQPRNLAKTVTVE